MTECGATMCSYSNCSVWYSFIRYLDVLRALTVIGLRLNYNIFQKYSCVIDTLFVDNIKLDDIEGTKEQLADSQKESPRVFPCFVRQPKRLNHTTISFDHSPFVDLLLLVVHYVRDHAMVLSSGDSNIETAFSCASMEPVISVCTLPRLNA